MFRPSRHAVVVTLAFAAFVSLGLPDAVLGVAWPSLRTTFGQPISAMGVLLAFGVAGYLASSFFAGQVVRAIGVGRLLLASTALVGLALVGYAVAPAWGWLLACAVCVGLGSGAVDAGLNAFAATAFSPRVVTWLHAFYGVGATIGPAVMTAAVTTADGSWRVGYACLAVTLLVMAVGFAFTLPLWQAKPEAAAATTPTPTAATPTGESAAPPGPQVGHAGFSEAARHPVVLLQVVLFLLYTGTEVTAGQWLFSLLAEGRAFPAAAAGSIVSVYWGALTVGRIAFGLLAARVTPLALLRVGLALAPLAAGLLCWRSSDAAAVAGAALLGFAMAPVFPMLISATPARVGRRLSAQAIGFQVAAATAGVAALPALAGVLARQVGLEVVPPFLLAATLALLGLHELIVAVVCRRAECGSPDRPAGR